MKTPSSRQQRPEFATPSMVQAQFLDRGAPGQSLAANVWRTAKSIGGEASEALDAVAPDRQHKAVIVVGGTAGFSSADVLQAS